MVKLDKDLAMKMANLKRLTDEIKKLTDSQDSIEGCVVQSFEISTKDYVPGKGNLLITIEITPVWANIILTALKGWVEANETK